MSIMYNLEREKGVEEKGGSRGRGSIFQVIKHCGVIVVTFNYLYFIERILFKLHFDNDMNNGNFNSYNFYGNTICVNKLSQFIVLSMCNKQLLRLKQGQNPLECKSKL